MGERLHQKWLKPEVQARPGYNPSDVGQARLDFAVRTCEVATAAWAMSAKLHPGQQILVNQLRTLYFWVVKAYEKSAQRHGWDWILQDWDYMEQVVAKGELHIAAKSLDPVLFIENNIDVLAEMLEEHAAAAEKVSRKKELKEYNRLQSLLEYERDRLILNTRGKRWQRAKRENPLI